MEYYTLQIDESPLYKGDISENLKVILTNINFVFIYIGNEIALKEEAVVEVIPVNEVKIYNSIPQIQQNGCIVEIYFKNTEKQLNFTSRREAYKFVKIAMELLTGQTVSERGAKKIKNGIGLIDDTLGINTVDTVKTVLENGVVKSFFGGIGKKKGKSKNVSKKSSLESTFQKVFEKGEASLIEKNKEKSIAEYNKELDSLKKMKDLVDKEVLTQEEFEKKKKEILG